MKKKDVFVSTIKGLITGIVSWVNNMSIASMILSVSSYEHVIDSFSNIRKKNNKDLWYVTIPILLGICFGLLAGYHLISFLLKRCQLQTIILFVGLFVGGIRVLFAKQKLILNKKNIFVSIMIITIGIVLIVFLKNINLAIKNNFLNSMVLGFITGISILIPGVSAITSNIKNGYTPIIDSLKHISLFKHFIIVIVFIIVCIITLVLLAKVIKVLMNKNKNNTYIALCSCMIISIVLLIIEIKPVAINFVSVFTSILAFLWGYIFAKNVERE